MHLPKIVTPCVRLPWPGRDDVWVKDESACPTGTFKDRLAWRLASLISSAARPDFLVTSISLGNTLVSLMAAFEAAFPPDRRPQVAGVFPADFAGRTIGPDNRGHRMKGEAVLAKLGNQGANCIEYDLAAGWLSPHAVADLARDSGMEFSQHRDVSNGIEVPSYQAIAAEALQQCGEKIDYIVVPVGAGVLFEETVRYIERHSRQSQVIGVTTLNHHSVADKIYAAYSQYMRDLVARGRAHYPGLPQHSVIPVDDNSIMHALSQIPAELSAEPSAAAAFSALDTAGLIPQDASVLIVNTGNGIAQEPVQCP
ncbi:MAG: PLP-dependent lyase/thiolase [Phycisphaerae bacterium]